MFGRFLNTPTNVFCSFFANDFLIRQCCWNVFFCIERTNWSFLKREISPHLCDFSMSVPNLVGRVLLWVSWVLKSSCHREYFKKIFSWVFPGSKFFFLAGISWVQVFFLRVFRGSKIFSRGYFVGPIFSRGYFVIQRLSVVGYMRKSGRKQWSINTSQHLKPRIIFHIDFINCQFCLF